MKLLYSVIILGLIQMVFIKPLAASSNSKKPPFRQKLKKFYNNELIAVDKDFCKKAKILIEKVLQDKLVQQPTTPIMKEFKQNITDFLQEYPLYMRYNLSNELLFQFDKKLPLSSNNKEIQYIWQLLEKQGYYNMSKDYESDNQKFVKQKLLPKFEELKQKLSPSELEQEEDFLMWYHELSKCLDYACQYKYILKLEDHTPKEILLDYIEKRLNNIYISYGKITQTISKNVLKDKKRLSQLPKVVRNNLTKSIKYFIKQYERHQTIKQLHNLIRKFYSRILSKYYHNKTLTLKDQKLIKQIFDAQGCAEFVSEFSHKLRNFVKLDVFEYFQQFKAAASQKELAKEKRLLQWYDRLKGLHNPKDIIKALDSINKYKNM